MRKNVYVFILSVLVIIDSVVPVRAMGLEENFKGITRGIVDGKETTYISSETLEKRIIKVLVDNKIDTIIYNKITGDLFINGNKENLFIEESRNNNPTTMSPLSSCRQVDIVKGRYNAKANMSKAVILAGLAAVVGGPVGVFLAVGSTVSGFKTSLIYIKRVYSCREGSKNYMKISTSVYNDRNWGEYLFTANWRSTRH